MGLLPNQVIQVNCISNGQADLLDLMHWKAHSVISDVSTKHVQLESTHEETCKPKLRDILINNRPVLFLNVNVIKDC